MKIAIGVVLTIAMSSCNRSSPADCSYDSGNETSNDSGSGQNPVKVSPAMKLDNSTDSGAAPVNNHTETGNPDADLSGKEAGTSMPGTDSRSAETSTKNEDATTSQSDSGADISGSDAQTLCRFNGDCKGLHQRCFPLIPGRPQMGGVCCACGDAKKCIQIGDACHPDANLDTYCRAYNVGNIYTVQVSCQPNGCNFNPQPIPDNQACFADDGYGICLTGKCTVKCKYGDPC